MPLDVDAVRARFPALAIRDQGRSRIYLDNPAGTQVPRGVVDATVHALVSANANLGGHFVTTVAAGETVERAHQAMADFLGAANPNEIIFGQNMTTLTMHVSRSLGRLLTGGDEIVVTRMDHDANVAPWLLLADDCGATVRWFDFDPESYEFELDDLDGVLSERTKIVAIGYASNLTGTINDVKEIAARAKAAGALVYVDAVQFAPHGLIDVQDLGADFLVCSAYKFYGPHQGILWGREDMLNEFHAYKVRPAHDHAPDKFETGTLSHEGMAGTAAAVDHMAWIGETMGDVESTSVGELTRRQKLSAGFAAITDYENSLTARLITGLSELPGLSIRGVANLNRIEHRVPTVSFTVEGHNSKEIAKALAGSNIFVWDGHNYALEAVRRLDLEEGGGVVRIGIAQYNAADEIDSTIAAVAAAVGV